MNLGKAADAAAWVENEKMDKSILREGNLDARILLRTGKLNDALEILKERKADNSLCPIHTVKPMCCSHLSIR